MSQIPGIKLLLMGAPGSGKTTAIESWITGKPATGKFVASPRTGIQVCGVFTEPSFDVVAEFKCPELHWVYLPPQSADWSDTLETMLNIQKYDTKTLANMNFRRSDLAYKLAQTMNKYVCERCGKDLGCVDSWGTDRMLHLDSLSGLNPMFMQLAAGGSPVKSIQEYGIAMEQEEKFLAKLCMGLKCHFTLVSHLDREVDQVTGGSNIYPAALGSKLGPKLSRFFTDVVFASQQAGKFVWSTAKGGADLKARNFPLADNIAPDMGLAIEKWLSRGGLIAS